MQVRRTTANSNAPLTFPPIDLLPLALPAQEKFLYILSANHLVVRSCLNLHLHLHIHIHPFATCRACSVTLLYLGPYRI